MSVLMTPPRVTIAPIVLRMLCASAALFASAGVASSVQARPAASAACDRRCLDHAIDRYLDAVARHDPAAAGLAPSFRATENAAVVAPGEGLWKTMTGLGALQRRYLDPATGQAAFYGLLEEGAKTAIAIVRIRVERGRVVESEAVIAREGERLYDPPGVLRNPPVADAAADVGSATPTTPRAALIAAADRYLDAMQAHSSAGVIQAQGCVRLESGFGGRPADGGPAHDCLGGFDHLVQISQVAHRRYPLVDERAGAVVGALMFLRAPGAVMPDGRPWKRNVLLDVFTFDHGLVRGIFGTTHYLEAEEPETTGWPDGEGARGGGDPH